MGSESHSRIANPSRETVALSVRGTELNYMTVGTERSIWKSLFSKGSPHPANLECPRCSSRKILRNGKRDPPNQHIQRYICNVCGYRFSKRPRTRANSREGSNSTDQGTQTRVSEKTGMTTVIALPQGKYVTGDIDHTTLILSRLDHYLRKRGRQPTTIEG